MNKPKRKKHYIEAQVQGALLQRMLLHWLVFIAASFVFLSTWQLLVSGDPIFGFSRVMQEIWVQNLAVFVTMVALLPVFVLDMVKLSHRFAGPIFRLRRCMGEVADGKDVAPVHLRKNDYWHDVAAEFNRVLERVAILQQAADEEKSPEEPAEISS